MKTMRLAIGIVAASCAGCTLVSGWSDLQGSHRDASTPAPNDRDARAPDDDAGAGGEDAAADASAAAESGTGPSVCPTQCASSDVCCWPSSSSGVRHCAAQCTSSEYTVTCHDGSDCGDGKVCCVAFAALRTDCVPIDECTSQRYVCGGSSPTCPSGMTCTDTLPPFTVCR